MPLIVRFQVFETKTACDAKLKAIEKLYREKSKFVQGYYVEDSEILEQLCEAQYP